MAESPTTRRSWLACVTGVVLEVVYCSLSSQASRRFTQKGRRQGTEIVGTINPGPRLGNSPSLPVPLPAEKGALSTVPALPPSPSIIPSLDRINSGLTRFRF